VLVIEQRAANGEDGVQPVACGFFDRSEHVHHPFLPRIAFPDVLEQSVVVGLRAHDVTAHVQHRDVEQTLIHQIHHVNDAAGASVAVVKRVNRLEPVMDERHLD
jgi:hypothetical protein